MESYVGLLVNPSVSGGSTSSGNGRLLAGKNSSCAINAACFVPQTQTVCLHMHHFSRLKWHSKRCHALRVLAQGTVEWCKQDKV